jgi:hypothetical protein
VGVVNGQQRYDISLWGDKAGQDYCPWCFDRIRDYDEKEVDCGGPNCPPCVEEKKPSTPLSDPSCGDGNCQNGNEYSCPQDCRTSKLTLLLLLFLFILLVANTVLCKWVRRRAKMKKMLNVTFELTKLAISGVMVWVAVSHICISPLDCEQVTNILEVTGIGGLIFVLVWWGVECAAWIRDRLIFYSDDRRSAGYYQEEKEIKRMIEKGEEYLEKNPYASEVIYTAIKPLYDSLPPDHKKKVIGRIRKYYRQILDRIKGGKIV